jgi:hypothetical protein
VRLETILLLFYGSPRRWDPFFFCFKEEIVKQDSAKRSCHRHAWERRPTSAGSSTMLNTEIHRAPRYGVMDGRVNCKNRRTSLVWNATTDSGLLIDGGWLVAATSHAPTLHLSTAFQVTASRLQPTGVPQRLSASLTWLVWAHRFAARTNLASLT